eukprot:gnl/TRDRNA2_/TRDRNA2_89810_c2_seq1.p1 gnl/TRDRNA2_/TRDRNA2_89810_c2~~gnl/TRDRNA2_/TRDRNA2_89810_c2_seq1.p1  ORF type:complete len:255 (+),score=71.07 gnl/TRDRNA2_/TRDRNA2_89810_c2_seq1:3-767(+)
MSCGEAILRSDDTESAGYVASAPTHDGATKPGATGNVLRGKKETSPGAKSVDSSASTKPHAEEKKDERIDASTHLLGNSKTSSQKSAEGAKSVGMAASNQKQPQATLSDASSRSSEGGGIITMLEMIYSDIEAEIHQARIDESARIEKAQLAYEAERKELIHAERALRLTLITKNKELAAQEALIEELKGARDQEKDDLDAETEKGKALLDECEWTKGFDDRREKRKTEIQGLMDAKNTLAGAEPVSADDLDVF